MPDFFAFIERLRNKPEGKRRQIAFGVAFSITALVFFFWLSSFFVNAPVLKDAKPIIAEEELAPLKQATESMAGAFQSLKGLFEGFGAVRYEEGSSSQN